MKGTVCSVFLGSLLIAATPGSAAVVKWRSVAQLSDHLKPAESAVSASGSADEEGSRPRDHSNFANERRSAAETITQAKKERRHAAETPNTIISQAVSELNAINAAAERDDFNADDLYRRRTHSDADDRKPSKESRSDGLNREAYWWFSDKVLSMEHPWDFSEAEVVTNNFGGYMGVMPKTPSAIKLPREMRYSNVARVGGAAVDLVISNRTEYTPVTADATNGLDGVCGIINIKGDTSVLLHFKFEDHASGFPINMDSFVFSFIDTARLGNDDTYTYDTDDGHMSPMTVEVSSEQRYTLRKESELFVNQTEDGWTSFHTTDVSRNTPPLPKDPMRLTAEQESRTVSFHFSGTSEFYARVYVGNGSTAGRNFTFMGATSLAIPAFQHLVYEAPSAITTSLSPLEVGAPSPGRAPSGSLTEDWPSESEEVVSELTSYWDYSGCGLGEPIQNAEWCQQPPEESSRRRRRRKKSSLLEPLPELTKFRGQLVAEPAPQAPSCQDIVDVDEDVCPLGQAYLKRVVGKGTEWSILRGGCIYAFFAIYSCHMSQVPAPAPLQPYKMRDETGNATKIPNTASASGIPKMHPHRDEGPFSTALQEILDPRRKVPDYITSTRAPVPLEDPVDLKFAATFLYAPMISGTPFGPGVVTATCRSGWAPVMNELQLINWVASTFGAPTSAVQIRKVQCLGEPLAQLAPGKHPIPQPCDAGLWAPVAVSFRLRPRAQLKKPLETSLAELAGQAGAASLTKLAGHETGAFAACSGLLIGSEDQIMPAPELPVQMPSNNALTLAKSAQMAADARGKQPNEVVTDAVMAAKAGLGSPFDIATAAANAGAQLAKERRASHDDTLRYGTAAAVATHVEPRDIIKAMSALGGELALEDRRSPTEVAKEVVAVSKAAGGRLEDVAGLAISAARESALHTAMARAAAEETR